MLTAFIWTKYPTNQFLKEFLPIIEESLELFGIILYIKTVIKYIDIKGFRIILQTPDKSQGYK